MVWGWCGIRWHGTGKERLGTLSEFRVSCRGALWPAAGMEVGCTTI